MVDETTADCFVVHTRILRAVKPAQEKTFKHVKPYEEDDDQTDGQDESAVGGEDRNGVIHNSIDMRPTGLEISCFHGVWESCGWPSRSVCANMKVERSKDGRASLQALRSPSRSGIDSLDGKVAATEACARACFSFAVVLLQMSVAVSLPSFTTRRGDEEIQSRNWQ